MSQPCVVLDMGSHTFKVGFAGEEHPHSLILNRLARPKNPPTNPNEKPQIYIGDNIPIGRWNRYWKGLNRLSFPVQDGIIQKEEEYNVIMSYLFYNELRIVPEESGLLLTESPVLGLEERQSYRRKMMSYLFDDLNVCSVGFISTSMSSLLASGQLDGVVVELGEETGHVSSIVDGKTISLVKMNTISGRSLSQYMSNISNSLTSSREIREFAIQDLKRDLMYCALDYEQEVKTYKFQTKPLEKTFELPDGCSVDITITEELCKYTEALFNPKLMELDGLGVQECILKSIEQLDDQIKRKLYGNVVLSGGSTCLRGFEDRLRLEMHNTPIKIRAPSERAFLPWIGGSIVASLSDFPERCISREQYYEEGIELALQKIHQF